MDRLQQAIQKARQERAARNPRSEPLQLTEDQQLVAEEPDDGLWTALPEISIDAKTVKSNRLMSYAGGHDAAPYDMLRTKVLQQTLSNGWRRLALTSPYSGAGKSTSTANLAFSLGRQTDLRILVIDFDMRRMGLAGVLGQTGKNSMGDVIKGKVRFEDHAVRHGENVIFGLNYVAARNPSEILQSRQMVETLEHIEATYKPDLIMFDTPPLMGSDDSHGFLKNVDCALLLVAAEKTSMDHIDLAERQLSELTNVMGVVLNKCRYISGAYGNEYGVY
ncbi:CpsD/CapB family tyrosine-protein kinase [Roseovarius arcticus]|uniref:CpsD/CapB family tyrosine-protein kinase n=1 Tax=Roseovarius arcticus TaxID=2547404 RepID=UPI0011106AB0|nr:CpsD/CapB family tyrosine-protein kinase [Roseovarius arcticus]